MARVLLRQQTASVIYLLLVGTNEQGLDHRRHPVVDSKDNTLAWDDASQARNEPLVEGQGSFVAHCLCDTVKGALVLCCTNTLHARLDGVHWLVDERTARAGDHATKHGVKKRQVLLARVIAHYLHVVVVHEKSCGLVGRLLGDGGDKTLVYAADALRAEDVGGAGDEREVLVDQPRFERFEGRHGEGSLQRACHDASHDRLQRTHLAVGVLELVGGERVTAESDAGLGHGAQHDGHEAAVQGDDSLAAYLLSRAVNDALVLVVRLGLQLGLDDLVRPGDSGFDATADGTGDDGHHRHAMPCVLGLLHFSHTRTAPSGSRVVTECARGR